MNASLDPTAEESHATAAVGPERVSLVQLAARSGGALSPALTRAVSNGAERRGPARVAVAAFQSSV
ncbi:FxSxx-COOH cyclophane-containing RiPP peptide [Streptomyces sp. MB09-02B]|uniref:FxSxx-COOH cyclophane-containing RiPP peptide n=1 Tax=Streptomyces sp. MB09-02B TaxID=3028667 RepID=UPI0029A31D62|nr:FxSxx-COOH cyclophane-containing RiPP peptide [Streptomyces sp. MB09-02B]MDX3645676.1 FxSxx-COOH protein [Streptomyces sp. MB09-02B]